MMPPRSRIALLCATNRGIAFARRLFALRPECEFAVCSFPEEPWEPRYLAALENLVKSRGHRFSVTRRVTPTDLFGDGRCDLMLAVSWRYLLPREIYGRARQGAFVFHDSLLPKYRGFSPTPWAMINGESKTGVTLLEIAEAPDSGRIVDQVAVPIGTEEYIDSVMARVTAAYLEMLERNLSSLLAGTAPLHAQSEADATYTNKRRPEDNRINWASPAHAIFNLIRACSNPYPGAYCFAQGKRLTIWTSDPPERSRPISSSAGQIVESVPGHGVRIATNDGTLLIRDVQPENGPVQTADRALSNLTEQLT